MFKNMFEKAVEFIFQTYFMPSKRQSWAKQARLTRSSFLAYWLAQACLAVANKHVYHLFQLLFIGAPQTQ